MNIHVSAQVHSGVTGAHADHSKLKAAAHEFEASMMKELLKPLERDSPLTESRESDDEEGSAGAMMSFGSQAMATAISERGGFGIATMILNRFTAGSNAEAEAIADHRLSSTAAPGTSKGLVIPADNRK